MDLTYTWTYTKIERKKNILKYSAIPQGAAARSLGVTASEDFLLLALSGKSGSLM